MLRQTSILVVLIFELLLVVIQIQKKQGCKKKWRLKKKN